MTDRKQEMSPFRPWKTMLGGCLILAVITPLSQFLTIKATNSVIETDTPVGWAVGILIGLVLVALVIRLLAKTGIFGHSNLALLYGMLALAVPLMNIGLVRQFFLASHTVIREYMYEGTSTYRTAYNALNDRWFPVVPTLEGLVWSKAERTLRLLDNPAVRQRQSAARRVAESFVSEALQPGTGGSETLHAMLPDLRKALPDLPLDAVAGFLTRLDPEMLESFGILESLQGILEEKNNRSREAREFLAGSVTARDEWALSLLPSNLEASGYSNRERLQEETDRLPAAERDLLTARVNELAGMEPDLRSAVAALGESDRGQLLELLRGRARERLDSLGRSAFHSERNRYIFRLERDERRSILRMDGVNGPNQNLFAFILGIWTTPQEKAAMEAMSWPERLRTVATAIPWNIYLKPLLSWGMLFLTIFLFLMCLAEWLRRKWVSRENLPFPLVEVADYLIRHDYELETAGDLTRPSRRGSSFQPLFLIGLAIGFILLLAQGAGHYGFLGGPAIIHFDFSKNVFDVAGGALKNLPETVFVLSPIVVGLVFLLSLEIGFSIWFTFLLYSVVIFGIKAANPNLTDGNWTGWADGKLYPFTMEQMLGAVLCFSVYQLWKVRKQGASGELETGNAYVPVNLTRWGLVLLPLAIYAMFWDLGLKNIPMLVMFTGAILVITVAIARVRAETGLPTNHAIYEFSKFPMIFGMTGAMGAKAYAAFLNLVFLPTTLLFRTLPQQLENMELARRYKIPFRTVAASGLAAVIAALAVGFVSFLGFSYYMGHEFYGFTVLPPLRAGEGALGIATYPLWVGHFLGEAGLERFTEVNWYRMIAIAGGFSGVGILLFLRTRFMRFPLHPIGYLVLLMTILYTYETPYVRVPDLKPLLTSTIWGSALVAWLIKRLVVKYGGMNVYKKTKPMFVGLIVGSVAAIFFWNMLDLGLSLYATRDVAPGDFIRRFVETTPFVPAYF